jgi:galactose mutarotase-like enzyme
MTARHMLTLWLACLLNQAAVAADPEPVADGFLVLENSRIRAVIAPEHGGELSGFAVRFDGRWHELIYRALDYSKQPGWRGKAPLLWPAVGASVRPGNRGNLYELDGIERAMPFHGFARDQVWRVVSNERVPGNSVVILEMDRAGALRDSYPFDYIMRVEYRLGDERLTLTYTIESNPDNQQAMPFSIGNHITFKAPLIDGSDAADVKFETDLPGLLVRDSNKVWSGEIIPSPFTTRHSIAELPHRSAISLGGRDGAAQIRILDPSGLELRMVHKASSEPTGPSIRFNLWVDTKAGFFSPEPWLGTQNSLNSGAGLVRLEPGQSWSWQIEIIPSVAARPGKSEAKENS